MCSFILSFIHKKKSLLFVFSCFQLPLKYKADGLESCIFKNASAFVGFFFFVCGFVFSWSHIFRWDDSKKEAWKFSRSTFQELIHSSHWRTMVVLILHLHARLVHSFHLQPLQLFVFAPSLCPDLKANAVSCLLLYWFTESGPRFTNCSQSHNYEESSSMSVLLDAVWNSFCIARCVPCCIWDYEEIFSSILATVIVENTSDFQCVNDCISSFPFHTQSNAQRSRRHGRNIHCCCSHVTVVLILGTLTLSNKDSS